jgi:uncharacterized protein (TIGR00251 family)
MGDPDAGHFARPHPEGALLHVRVKPSARCSAVLGVHGDSVRIAVAAPPVRDKANRELCAFVAACLGTSRSAVSVVRGRSARDKALLVRGLTPARAASALLEL